MEVLGDDLPARRARRRKVRQRDEERDYKGRGGEQAKGVLHARKRVVHGGGRTRRSVRFPEK